MGRMFFWNAAAPGESAAADFTVKATVASSAKMAD
jgi:hypothetical protein